MKTATSVAILLTSFVAFTNAFLQQCPAKSVGKAMVSPLSRNNNKDINSINSNNSNNDSPLVLHNALREYANWNDVWDGDYGYGGYGGMGGGGYGPYRSGYRRGGGYGGGYG